MKDSCIKWAGMQSHNPHILH